MNPFDVLVKAFCALRESQRDNLLWHIDNGTQILCGKNASDWVIKGAG